MRLRRFLIIILIVGGVGFAAWKLLHAGLQRFTGTGTTVVEKWVGKQLAAIANAHLGPTLSFDRMGYAYPRTVTLHNVRLTADDVPIIAADALRVEFAEVPRRGRPIVLESVRFQRPVVRLIQHEGGTLLGFSDFVKPGGGAVTPDGGSTRLSDVLAIERIEVAAGEVHYEKPDRPAMRLRPLTFVLQRDARVASDSAPDAGWYAFESRLALAPVAQLDLDARLNLDTAVFDVTSAALHTSLVPAQYEIFTPELQEVLRRYEIVGELDWTLRGVVPLRDTAGTAIDMHLSLTEASMSLGDYVLPLDSFDAAASMGDGVLELSELTVESLGGSARMSAKQWLAGADAGRFEMEGSGLDLDIEQALNLPDDVEPAVTGQLDFQVRAAGSFRDLGGTFGGDGDVLVDNGHFAFLDLLRSTLNIKGKRSDRDSGSADFKLGPDRVRWRDVKLSGDALGVAGSGDLLYDGRLDFLVAAGPLQGRHGVIGFFGDAVGAVTSRLVAYRVSGTVRETKIDVAPLEVGGVKEKKDN
jgi:hypothetical protein